MMRPDHQLSVIGCGEVFNALESDAADFNFETEKVVFIRLNDVSEAAQFADQFLPSKNPLEEDVFVAIDDHALNYARLEIYARARLMGFKMPTVVHQSAHISRTARMGDNVYVGAGSLIAANCQIASNSFIGAGVRIDADSSIAAHSWVGSGARIGRQSELSSHVVIHADAVLRAQTHVGAHCWLDASTTWHGDVPTGTLMEPGYRAPARIIGPGYSYEKRRSK